MDVDLVQRIAEQGVVGLLLAGSLVINWKLGTLLLGEKEMRRADMERFKDDFREIAASVADAMSGGKT